MNFPEKKLRVYGYLTVTVFFFLFFMLEMFFSSWKIPLLLPKVILITIPLTLAFWEPTRWVILRMRKKYKSIGATWKRFRLSLQILIPYGILLGMLRVFLENYFNVWGHTVAFAWYATWTTGTILLFIFVQLFVYEGVYFFQQWAKSLTEAEELKRLHLKTQFDSLKVQIQPHFLFNSLNTLIALIEFQPAKATKFTHELAYMYRYFLEANSRHLVSLEDELNFARTYFFLLKTRYDEGLHLKIYGAEALENYMIPPLSLQLLLENAIKHNVITMAHPLYIYIDILPDAKVVTVRNEIRLKSNANSTGHGLAHLKKKFYLMELPPVIIHDDKVNREFCVTIPIIELPVMNKVEKG